MYNVSHFTRDDKDAVLNFMDAHSFALVTGIGNEYPVATQLPLEIIKENEQLLLTGHLMRNTDHHIAFQQNPHVLVIFSGPSAYIDAGWYNNPRVASTVNYMSVHARGKIVFTDEKGTFEAIKQVTEKHIAPGSGGSFENLADSYIDDMLKAIIGFRIEVTGVQHVFKLSQNRDAADRQNIIKHLQARGNAGDIFIAGEMIKRI